MLSDAREFNPEGMGPVSDPAHLQEKLKSLRAKGKEEEARLLEKQLTDARIKTEQFKL